MVGILVVVFNYVRVRSAVFEKLYIGVRIVVFGDVLNTNSNHAPALNCIGRGCGFRLDLRLRGNTVVGLFDRGERR
jgi:hypothetical protein